MAEPSTKNLSLLPNPTELKAICKAISALDAIICQEWEHRYYSYQTNWSKNEELFEIQNGQGDQLLILFSKMGTCINGFAHESEMNGWARAAKKKSFFKMFFSSREKRTQELPKGITDGLPRVFNDFIFGEPVKSIGTTFCIWQTAIDSGWEIGSTISSEDEIKDGSTDLLQLLDGTPFDYKVWAEEYYKIEELPLEAIERLYNQAVLTRELVALINPARGDLESLKSDLQEIDYPFQFQ